MLVEAAVDGSAIGAHVDVEFFEFGGYGFNGCSELDDGFAGVAGAGVQARQGHHGAGPSDTDARTDYGSPDFDQGGEGVWFKLATVRSCVISGLGGAFYHDTEGGEMPFDGREGHYWVSFCSVASGRRTG